MYVDLLLANISNTPARVGPYYISSHALAKVFEHRNFVALYQRETNHITVARVAPLVTRMLAYNIGRNIQLFKK